MSASRAGEVRRSISRARFRALVSLLAIGAMLVAAASASAYTARGSVEQVDVTGLAPNVEATLLNAKGKAVAKQSADAQGGLLFRNVAPGEGYVVSVGGEKASPVTVHTQASKPWDPQIYAEQEIPDNGFTYLKTRDGTELSIDVHPPSSPAGEPGVPSMFHFPTLPIPGVPSIPFTAPYPTLIEYSGYGYANPKGPENGIAVLANLMGFAVVDVNMRGTGCSGGAFDFFEPLQSLDGYDVVETIARQSWVKGGKVGMLGISYGGISQQFTAQTDPARLAAIAPLSVIDATATTLYPGGILNNGFAVAWAEQRQQNAEPATGPGHGQEWANERISEGDTTCAANQALHGEAANLLQKIKANATYNPKVADPLDPDTFVNKITVPTFMACQWEDEQTGGHCADLAEHFTGTTKKWFTFTNGAHIDSLDPYTYDRMYDFLKLYVAEEAPLVGASLVHAAAPVIYDEAMGLPKEDIVTLPEDPIQNEPTYEKALAAFEALPSIRVLFDNGAGTSPTGSTTAGNPYPGFEGSFSEFPIPGTTAETWYLGPEGTLTDNPASGKGTSVDSYTSNVAAMPATDFGSNTGSGGLWGNASQWDWKWQQSSPGAALSYVSAPLTEDAVAIGAGAVKLWVKSSTPDVDLQATISEVRPDGNETFVQDGWLRASERKLAKPGKPEKNMFKQEPTELQPIPLFTAKAKKAMPAGKFVPVTIPLYFEGHAYRAGSSIRVTIAAPNGTQPIWSSNETEPEGGTSNVAVEFSSHKRSGVTLPIVPGVSVPTALPACPSLRNEPCRPYQTFVNEGS